MYLRPHTDRGPAQKARTAQGPVWAALATSACRALAGSSACVENLAEEWDKPSFTMEQKQAAIAQTLTAVIVKPASRKGGPFHPDQIVPVSREDIDEPA